MLEDTEEQRVAPITELNELVPPNQVEAQRLQQRYEPSAAWMIAGNFEFCDAETIAASQQFHIKDLGTELIASRKQEEEPHLILTNDGKIWIPSADDELICRILVIGHSAGHRGYVATMQSLNNFYFIDKKRRVRIFIKNCLACCKADDKIVRRKNGHYMTTRPNEIVSTDMCFIYRCDGQPSWIHVIKDLFSGFCLLRPVATPSAKSAVPGLMMWLAMFGKMKLLLSDMGPEFKNRLTKFLQQKLGFNHHISTPSGCRTGIVGTASVERLNMSLVRMLRAVMSARQMDMRSWVQVLPAIQMYLNCCAKQDLGGCSSTEVHTGLKPRTPTELAWFSEHADIKRVQCFSLPVQEVRAHMVDLVQKMKLLHRRVHDLRQRRQAYNDRINLKKGATDAEFQEGDYVLVHHKPKKRPKSKIQVTFSGPWQVARKVTRFLYDVKPLYGNTRTEERVHTRRIKPYMDGKIGATELLRSWAEGDDVEFQIDKFTGWRQDKKTGDIQLRTRRLGFAQEGYDTWDNLQDVWRQDSELVLQYLKDQYDITRDQSVREAIEELMDQGCLTSEDEEAGIQSDDQVIDKHTEKEIKEEAESQSIKGFQMGDRVHAPAYMFGAAWAKKKYKTRWKTQKETGTIVQLIDSDTCSVIWDGDSNPLSSSYRHLTKIRKNQSVKMLRRVQGIFDNLWNRCLGPAAKAETYTQTKQSTRKNSKRKGILI